MSAEQENFHNMSEESSNRNRPLSDRKTNDRSLVLLLVGCLLLTPPIAGIFQIDIRFLGIPFTGFYLFTVWAGLIAGAAALSKRIQKNADWNNPDDTETRDQLDNTD